MKNWILPFVFMLTASATIAQNALYPVRKDDKTGFIDQNGKLVVTCQYDPVNNSDLRDFGEGMIPFSSGRKWGMLDGKGKIVVQPTYNRINSFYKGYARVEKTPPGSYSSLSNTAGFINNKGEEVLVPDYNLPFFTSYGVNEDLVVIRGEDKKEHYIAVKGKTCNISESYNTAGDFKQGLAPVRKEKESLAGYIDKTGNWAIEPRFRYAQSFLPEGIAVVGFEDKTWGFIDKSGKTVVDGLTYSTTGFGNPQFVEGLMLVSKDEKYGFIDPSGKLKLGFDYDHCAGNFSGGLTIVNKGCTKEKDNWGFTTVKGGTWMIIDKNGKVKKELSGYDEVSSFSEGMAIVEKDKKYGFINAKGEEIVAPKWEERPEYFKNGLARFYMPGAASYSAVKPFGYINKQGKVVWEPSM